MATFIIVIATDHDHDPGDCNHNDWGPNCLCSLCLLLHLLLSLCASRVSFSSCDSLSIMPARRIDPQDGMAYTWEEFLFCYSGRYGTKAIEKYWRKCAVKSPWSKMPQPIQPATKGDYWKSEMPLSPNWVPNSCGQAIGREILAMIKTQADAQDSFTHSHLHDYWADWEEAEEVDEASFEADLEAAYTTRLPDLPPARRAEAEEKAREIEAAAFP
eukprot:s281_g6.t2